MLAFTGWRDLAEIYVVPVAGGEPSRVMFDHTHIWGITWMPNGRYLLHVQDRRESDILVLENLR